MSIKFTGGIGLPDIYTPCLTADLVHRHPPLEWLRVCTAHDHSINQLNLMLCNDFSYIDHNVIFAVPNGKRIPSSWFIQ